MLPQNGFIKRAGKYSTAYDVFSISSNTGKLQVRKRVSPFIRYRISC